ncbi:MAG: hypothetical protein AAF604_07110 [Acidobacteriota bacterium]
MSCPNWTELTEQRFEMVETEASEAAWQEALEHAASCADCDGRAAAADPLAILAPLSDDLTDLADAYDMRRAVTAMRRGERVRPEASAAGWPRFAAAAGLAVALVTLGSGTPSGISPAGEMVASETGPWVSETAPVIWEPPILPTEHWLAVPGNGPAAEALDEMPVFDELQSPQAASVYQLAGDDLHVVMVVHETLDV